MVNTRSINRRGKLGGVLILLSFGFAAASPSVALARQSDTEVTLRAATQQLLDAIAPGDVATWDRWLDPDAIQVDENDVVRRKPEILKELTPLGPGLAGHLKIDDFRIVEAGDVAVVTHEDDEYLDYHGQVLLSRFRMTDTWHKTPDGWRQLGSQVLAVLQDPPRIELDRQTLCTYAGRYALTADIAATIRCEKDHLVVERSGRPPREFVPELKDVFFERGAPRTRRIFLHDASGRITGFVDRREARDIAWKKIS
jgi:ketosteroid isomerase-like protein